MYLNGFCGSKKLDIKALYDYNRSLARYFVKNFKKFAVWNENILPPLRSA